jgi:Transposase zinc-binding domain
VEAAACAKPATGYTYVRREPEKTALYKVLQQHLLTFEQLWTDKSDGRTLPSFVTEELHKFLDCGILARGFAHLFCKTCHEHYVVALSCKARAVCPSCLGRRMNEGAFNLTENVDTHCTSMFSNACRPSCTSSYYQAGDVETRHRYGRRRRSNAVKRVAVASSIFSQYTFWCVPKSARIAGRTPLLIQPWTMASLTPRRATSPGTEYRPSGRRGGRGGLRWRSRATRSIPNRLLIVRTRSRYHKRPVPVCSPSLLSCRAISSSWIPRGKVANALHDFGAMAMVLTALGPRHFEFSYHSALPLHADFGHALGQIDRM